MTKWLFVVAVALTTGLFIMSWVAPGHAQSTGQPTFINPYAPPSAPPKHPLLQGANPSAGGASASTNKPAANEPEPNADIKVTPQAGEWMICVHVYKGEEAHQMARQLVSVLRSKEYGLWAYIFDHTPEARKKQETIRQEQIDKYVHSYKVMGLPPPKELKIRVPKVEVQDEVAVLVGGYKDMKTARAALDELKKLPMPRPYPDTEELQKKEPDLSKCVKMDKMWIIKNKQPTEVYVNPLTQGFVAKNPVLPKQASNATEWDLSLLKALNADESFSLLKCPKKITLVVKEYRLPTYIQQGDTPPDTGKKSIFGQSPERTDLAYHNAHNLAGLLRERGKFDTYVLHDRAVSLVTVGGFDSLDDPAIKTTQQRITAYHQKVATLAQSSPQCDGLQIFPIGMPMKVPR